jgi:hypothetical protein
MGVSKAGSASRIIIGNGQLISRWSTMSNGSPRFHTNDIEFNGARAASSAIERLFYDLLRNQEREQTYSC